MLELAVDGMTCAHCVAAIDRAVSSLPGVRDVAIDLAGGKVRIDGQPDPDQVCAAIAGEGYQVRLA